MNKALWHMSKTSMDYLLIRISAMCWLIDFLFLSIIFLRVLFVFLIYSTSVLNKRTKYEDWKLLCTSMQAIIRITQKALRYRYFKIQLIQKRVNITSKKKMVKVQGMGVIITYSLTITFVKIKWINTDNIIQVKKL